ASMRSRVDLPQPEGPTRTTNSPSAMSTLTPWSTSKLPNPFRTSRISTGATHRLPRPQHDEPVLPPAFTRAIISNRNRSASNHLRKSDQISTRAACRKFGLSPHSAQPTGRFALGFGFIPAAWSPYLLSVLRIVAALEFLQHGTAKYLKFPAVKMYENFNAVSPAGVAGFFGRIGGLFLL